MIERALLIGFGEVGQAHFKNLAKVYPNKIFYKDKEDTLFDSNGKEWRYDDEEFDLLLIATQCNPEDMGPFYKMVIDYAEKYKPKYIDILTTTPCGACDIIQERTDAQVSRSSIRGMHPNLDKFLIDIPKHIGGGSPELKEYYEKAGITCVVHAKAKVVEFQHKWNNIIYGANVMITNECAKDARREGIDYMEFIPYRITNNSGFIKAGHPSKVSPILYPSGGGVGGHCVQYAATTIPKEHRGPITNLLAEYNNVQKN